MGAAPRRLLFVAWTLLASLVLLEVVLQVGALVATPDAATPPTSTDDSGLVVLAVGDSWVAGAEANPGAGFVDRLAERLPGALGEDVRVVNRGRSGANSAHVALTVLDEAEGLGADLILVLVGQNNSTNFARVAEVEERLAAATGAPPGDAPRGWEPRTIKLARILWANLSGGEGYEEQLAPAPPPTPDIPPMEFDVEGHPVVQSPERVAAALAPLSVNSTQADPEEEIALFQAYRAAREARDWRAVDRYGAALATLPERSALSDLGAAESALLRGDWKRARALLIAASNRAPGVEPVLDLACRFPPEASDVKVQEACEQEPQPEVTALGRARIADGTLDPHGAAEARAEWLEEHPGDLATRVDLALWRAHIGDLAGADALMGYEGAPEQPMPPPVRPDADHWRFYVLRNAELGDEAIALQAVERALTELESAPPSAPLLGAIAHVLAEYADCARLPSIVERWYRVRGDALGASRALAACLSPAEGAQRIAAWRTAWDPSPPPSSFEALARAGNRPLALLERDLDIVLQEARRLDAAVLLLDYPNPSDDHAALARLIEEYATSRATTRVSLRSGFAEALDESAWRDELGPNGHCNARGYDRMATMLIDPVVSALSPGVPRP